MSSSVKSGGQRLGDSIRIWLIAGRSAKGSDESEGLLGGELVGDWEGEVSSCLVFFLGFSS